MKHLTVFLLSLLMALTVVAQEDATDEVVLVKTKHGTIVFILFDETPVHKENFLKLAEAGFYNGSTFHRVIDGFMIQGGDWNTKPDKDGSMVLDENGQAKTLPAEINNKFIHSKGAVAAARLGDAVNPEYRSSPCQFYIVENEWGAHFLDRKYTIFGMVIEGLDAVEQIAAQETDDKDKPLKDIRMKVKVKTMKKSDITKKYGYVYD